MVILLMWTGWGVMLVHVLDTRTLLLPALRRDCIGASLCFRGSSFDSSRRDSQAET